MSKKTAPKQPSEENVIGDIISERQTLNLQGLCENCSVTPAQITAYIHEGMIDIQGDKPEQWSFSHMTMIRIRKATRLEQDLGLNPAGAVLALELMDEIEKLKTRLKRYEKR